MFCPSKGHPMTDLQKYLRSQPWWTSRFMWGIEAARLMMIYAVWHSRFPMHELATLDEDDMA